VAEHIQVFIGQIIITGIAALISQLYDAGNSQCGITNLANVTQGNVMQN